MNQFIVKHSKLKKRRIRKIINAKMEITRDARVIEILIPTYSTFIPSARTPMGVKKKNVAGVAVIETVQTLLYLVKERPELCYPSGTMETVDDAKKAVKLMEMNGISGAKSGNEVSDKDLKNAGIDCLEEKTSRLDYIKIDGEIKRIDNVEEKLNDFSEKYEGARLTWSTTPYGPEKKVAKKSMDDAKLALKKYIELIGYNAGHAF